MDWLIIFAMVMLSHAVSGPAEERWPAVLAGLDVIRSHAFEEGRSDDLALVYPEGSLLLRRDNTLLVSYLSRGVDIERMRMRLIDSHVTSVNPRRVTMDVTDQLVEALRQVRSDRLRRRDRRAARALHAEVDIVYQKFCSHFFFP